MRLSAALACLLVAGSAGAADDTRTLVPLTPAAQATLRAEMLGNLRALDEILRLVADGRLADAGTVAESELGISAMSRNRLLPPDARPGPQMPAAMHALGVDGHRSASRFAEAAARGDRDAALRGLGELTTACVACHHAYRTR